MDNGPFLKLGAWRHLDGRAGGKVLRLPARHLVTHGVVAGMTGFGKSGLVTVLIEEAISAGIPALIIDVKGDLPNLLLAFADSAPQDFLPWLETTGDHAEPLALARAEELAKRRRAFAAWSISQHDVANYVGRTNVRVITPGSTAGELLHVLSPLERRSPRWNNDPESARAALSAAVSLVLRLLGRDPDPAKSKEHVLLSLLAERRMLSGGDANLAALMEDLISPPIAEIGALPVNSFLRRNERANLAAGLNTLLASPTFATWRQGATLDIGNWLTVRGGRTPAVVVSVAHLDDEERSLVLGVILEELLSWVRSLSGSQRLRALLVFDEV